MNSEVAMMMLIQDHDLFVQEFQKLINSKNFTNMKIDEDENGVVIHLEGPLDVEKQQKRARLLKTLEKTAGLLKSYPDSVKKEFQSIADREGEEDREDSHL
jgi:hypothetical protein